MSRCVLRGAGSQKQRLSGDGSGRRVVGEEYPTRLVDTLPESDFDGGKSAAKVERIKEIEQELKASKN